MKINNTGGDTSTLLSNTVFSLKLRTRTDELIRYAKVTHTILHAILIILFLGACAGIMALPVHPLIKVLGIVLLVFSWSFYQFAWLGHELWTQRSHTEKMNQLSKLVGYPDRINSLYVKLKAGNDDLYVLLEDFSSKPYPIGDTIELYEHQLVGLDSCGHHSREGYVLRATIVTPKNRL